ncbi:pneumococcal serine-rich repeat protein-like [Thrips palmi]|uniref:Pneumococcal serine-rich repeat protein-like n=1 Tax=Thrips palmi TaxID=161013 RepID=A0A6P8ZSP9_THRPL|nr:pneumococcal serine-rich repeat protein-like [Thrips palmi]
MAMSSAAAWLLLVAAGCAVAVDAVGGPPPVDDRIRTDIFARGLRPRFSLPSKEGPQLPLETLKAIDKLWDLPFFQDDDENLKSVQNMVTVTTDDIDKADNVMHPPLEYSVPETFRQPDDAFFDSVADTEAWDSSTEAAEAADESTQGSDTRRLADWLPEGVQKYLPKVPTLSSILPSYIPGVNLQAEVHRKPIRLPVIPSAADVKVYVNTLLQRAFDNLHRKQLQLAELIKCSCPRPARCDAILEEFLDGIKTNKKPSSPSAANIATPAGAGAGAATGANAGSASPQLSFYAGLTKPDGEEGPGLGFYVDQSGPHFSHHSPQHQQQHQQHQATAQSQASATSAAAGPSSSKPPVPAGSRPSKPSRPSGSAAQSQASATSAAQSQASRPSSSASAQSSAQSSTHASKPSGPSGSASSHSSASASSHSSAASSHTSASASSHSSAASSHSSASASSHSSASGSGPNASATALSSASASAHRQQLQGGVSVPPAVPPVPTPTEYTATYGAPTPTLPLPTFAAPPTVGRAPAPIALGLPSDTSDDYPYSFSPDEPPTTTIPDRAEPSEPLYPSQPDPETATSPMTRE